MKLDKVSFTNLPAPSCLYSLCYFYLRLMGCWAGYCQNLQGLNPDEWHSNEKSAGWFGTSFRSDNCGNAQTRPIGRGARAKNQSGNPDPETIRRLASR